MSTQQTNGTAASATPKLQASDVGWQFVPQYYTFLHDSPHKLHCFYNKRSTFIHGVEGEDVKPCFGQQEIHDRILSMNFNKCKAYIHSIDSQSSIAGGIIIQVIGEMQNNGGPQWRKFTQTFFLAEQPNGYFVLNDIFRYLKEEGEDEEEEEQQQPVAAQATEQEPVAIAPEVEQQAPAEAAVVPEPTSEPTPAPAVEASKPNGESTPAQEPIVERAETTPEVPAVEEPAVEKDPETKQPEPVKTPEPVKAAQPAAAPAPAAAQQQQQQAPKPTGPPAPRTWASTAAAAKGAWGNALAAKTETSSSAASSPATAVNTPVRAAPAQKPQQQQQQQQQSANAAPAPQQAGQAASGSGGKFPLLEAAKTVNVRSCFVKLNNWQASGQNTEETMSKEQLGELLSRFGEIASVEIVRNKACAFVEYKSVESARKAIIASLLTNQGGEGGVRTADGQRIIVEARKEKEDRVKGAGAKKGGNAAGAATPAAGAGPNGPAAGAAQNKDSNEGFVPARTGRQHQGGRGGANAGGARTGGGNRGGKGGAQQQQQQGAAAASTK